MVGVLPGLSKAEANRYVTIPLATGLGAIRSHLIIRVSDAIIMISGSTGTLNEATIACGQKPLEVLKGTGSWSDRLRQVAYNGCHFDQRGTSEILFAATPEEAVGKAIDLDTRNQPKRVPFEREP